MLKSHITPSSQSSDGDGNSDSKVNQHKSDDSFTKREDFDIKRLSRFLLKLTTNLDVKHLDLDSIVSTVEVGLPAKVTLDELYGLVSETLASRTIYHPDYALLAGRVAARRIQKHVSTSFSGAVIKLWNHRSSVTNNRSNGNKTSRTYSIVSESLYKIVMQHRHFFDSLIEKDRDFDLTYFAIKTLERSYLLKINDEMAETPQYMFLRVAIGIHGNNLDDVVETYELMSSRYFIHASPTLFNAGSEYNYLSSCFLVDMEDDSIDGIYKTLHKTALISKASGGIGLNVHNIRASGSLIASTNGTSSGLVPMLRVFNDTARYVDQGGNKRPGAFAIYIEPWHADIFSVLDMKKNHGKEELRARDLFFALWIPDLFMQKVKDDEDWCLFSPDEAPGLADCYGDEFVDLYNQYEAEGRARTVVKAHKLWLAILESQTETGGPYMLYKDSCNRKSNQKNLGTIKSSNLCCEIVEYCSSEETAVCNLGSLALPAFIKSVSIDNLDEEVLEFDFEKLHSITKVLTRNLNKVIDVTLYPVESTKVSNMKHRPIALGVQGLADVFLELRLPFSSDEAKKLNIQIFETIYHAAVEASVELAMSEGPYNSFEGSPASKGILQFDLWDHKPSELYNDWDSLKESVKTHGLRNSLLVAPMPTASTSQILGYNECFEPYTSNLYTRRVLAGEYQVANKYLVKDLIDLGLWNSAVRNKIIVDNGSIQNISSIPQELKELYKTVWEISQKVIIDMAADRGKFIDQLQSMNIHLQNPTFGKLTSCHFYGWQKGLKTGMYYLRTQAASRAIQFTVNNEEIENMDTAPGATIKSLHRKRYKQVDSVEIQENVSFSQERKKMRTNNQEPYVTPESQSPYETGSKLFERIDIYDSTPVACELKDAEHCEACSG